MAPSRIDWLLAQLHDVVGEARFVSPDDPRWGVYWTKARRLADQVDELVPQQNRPVTSEIGRDRTRRGARPSSLPHHYPNTAHG
jgi:hypothetical protein